MKRLTATVMVTVAVAAALALAPAVLGAAGLTGTYSGKLATKVAKNATLNGTWKLTFAAGGKYTIARNGVSLIHGTAAFASGGKITFGHESGPAACPASEPGSYRYAVNGKTLSFSLVKDTCTGRLAVLTLVTYKHV